MTTSTSGSGGQCAERRDDRGRSPLALHARLADHDPRRREAAADRGHEIAPRGGIRPREDRDRPWEPWKPALALGREQPLGGELPLQALELDEMGPEADSLDRRGAKAELSLELVELGSARDVNRLAFLEVELETVERSPCDRHAQRGARLRVLEREEDVRPRLVASELRHLAFDPDGGKPPEIPARRLG